MKKMTNAVRAELRLAKRIWGALPRHSAHVLAQLVVNHCLSIGAGDVAYLDRKWYVTHTGLVRLARRKKCSGIHVEAVASLCDAAANRFVLKATVYPSKSSTGFVGYGDADPSNVSSLVRGAETRVAETRAVNRALRKAYGIGICSVEEIAPTTPSGTAQVSRSCLRKRLRNGNGLAAPKSATAFARSFANTSSMPTLVKSYATDFCGVKSLREAPASRSRTSSQELSDWAEKDRNALLCQLNSYMPTRTEEKEGAA